MMETYILLTFPLPTTFLVLSLDNHNELIQNLRIQKSYLIFLSQKSILEIIWNYRKHIERSLNSNFLSYQTLQ